MKYPDQIKGELNKLAAALGIKAAKEMSSIFGRWSDLVGPEVAGRCQPISLDKGVLAIAASSGAWAQELKYLAPALLETINERLGRRVVARISVKVGHPGARPIPTETETEPRPAPPQKPPVGRGLQEALEAAGNIPDDDLAKAAKRALLSAKTRSEEAREMVRSEGDFRGQKRPPGSTGRRSRKQPE